MCVDDDAEVDGFKADADDEEDEAGIDDDFDDDDLGVLDDDDEEPPPISLSKASDAVFDEDEE